MKPLIVVVGETASGKSALALDIARKFDGEIIGADSWTVYKEFDIGTAKPSRAETAEIPHHLFDVADPLEGFNAAKFKRLADSAITEIQSRGKVPILVGGTGLYIDSVIYDFEFMNPGDPAERLRLSILSVDELLAEADAAGVSLAGVDVANKRRIVRAIETNGQEPQSKELRANTILFGIQTDRETLRANVVKRVDTMLELGLENEVEALSLAYSWDIEPMKGIGYREWRDYFLGTQTLAETRERIISSTMKLAKKQRTWFKRNNSIHWLSNRDDYVAILTTLMNKKS